MLYLQFPSFGVRELSGWGAPWGSGATCWSTTPWGSTMPWWSPKLWRSTTLWWPSDSWIGRNVFGGGLVTLVNSIAFFILSSGHTIKCTQIGFSDHCGTSLFSLYCSLWCHLQKSTFLRSSRISRIFTFTCTHIFPFQISSLNISL